MEARMKHTILIALTSFGWTAHAQNMIPALMNGQVLMNAEGGKVHACGLRLVAMPESASAGELTELYDVSLNMSKQYGAAVKLSAQQGRFITGKPVLKSIRVHGGWIKATGAEPAPPIGGYLTGDSKDTILYRAEILPMGKIMAAMISGNSAQIAIETDKGRPKIYFGKMEITEQEKDQWRSCFADLVGK